MRQDISYYHQGQISTNLFATSTGNVSIHSGHTSAVVISSCRSPPDCDPTNHNRFGYTGCESHQFPPSFFQTTGPTLLDRYLSGINASVRPPMSLGFPLVFLLREYFPDGLIKGWTDTHVVGQHGILRISRYRFIRSPITGLSSEYPESAVCSHRYLDQLSDNFRKDHQRD